LSTSKNGHVLIVGAGPVGLAAALELARLRYPVQIIEKNTEPSTHSKAFGINARTLELLEPSGLTESSLQKAIKIKEG
jgi:2-polyprenyl-6-methoxyphenol hydroxylase-like FAD-dependent oxidoreductase